MSNEIFEDSCSDNSTCEFSTPILTSWDIFAVPDKIDTLIPGLGIKPGPVTIFCAASGIGKSVILQAAVESAAMGDPLWGMFPVERPLKILWIDLEQGKQTTLLRFKRIALANNFTAEDLEGKLEVVISPDVYSEESLHNLISGYDLCVIDCLRVYIGDVEENDSRARGPLDTAYRVSEETGCAIILIHHSRKDEKGAERDVLRGSSALQNVSDRQKPRGCDRDERGGRFLVRLG